jgi:hypothetical protein
MARRIPFDGPDVLSRKRTADMLRRLRELTQEVKMLKARLDAEGEEEMRPKKLHPRPRRQPN